MAAASFAAVLRNGAHILSGNSLSFPFHSTRTFAGYLSSSSFKEKGRRKGQQGVSVALVSSSLYNIHVSVGNAARRSARFFCASFEAETTSADTNTAVEDATLSSPSPSPVATDSTESSSPSIPITDPIKDAVGALDIRVGRILKAWRHPEADSLYIEEVDLGEPEPRTICSGLVNYIPLDDLQDAQVIVLANLKPRNMCGVKSNGMLLCASDASHENVELLQPPEGAFPGERIWFGSEDENNQSAAASPNQVQKKKIWELVKPHMKTDGSCAAVLGVHPMRTSAGVVVCRSLRDGNIS
ncbi:tRNA-binding domain [Macleaya cordata]|uniref:tRNA-binding domain n=1 Tax=Macleaya cordata TaxID=56857 RepID=A0A200QIE0_MACCD|nr:tRNA-binding domain [Macleaya cordata]